MGFRLAVLASGSSGNATLLEADGFGLLIDAGLGPRQLASRLAAVGASWHKVNAVVLTHTHSDHWRDRTFEHLRRLNIPLYCHGEHHAALRAYSSAFAALTKGGLVRAYERDNELWISQRLCCRPFELSHDSTPTFGFRFEGGEGLFGPSWAVGYAADLGCWTPELVELLADADILALEFNHDEHLERTSRRPQMLIERVLGEYGHLSNAQAAEFLTAILASCEAGPPQHVIQLHLSRECNRPALAAAAAREVLSRHAVTLHTAVQGRVGPILSLEGRRRTIRRMPRSRLSALPAACRTLPGMD